MTRRFVLALVLTLLTSGVHSGTTISDEVLELLRLLDPSAAASYEGTGRNIVGGKENEKGMHDDVTEGTGDTEGDANGDTRNNFGDSDGDNRGTGDIEGDADGDSGNNDQDTAGETEDTDVDKESTGDTDGNYELDDEDTVGENGDTYGHSEDTTDEAEENLVPGAGAHGLSVQNRRQSSGTTISDEVRELLRLLDPSAAATYDDTGGDIVGFKGNAKGMHNGDAEGMEGDTNEETIGGTKGTDVENKGIGDADGETDGDTDGDNEDNELDPEHTEGETEVIDLDEIGTLGADEDTDEDTDGVTENNVLDSEDTEGETENIDGEPENIDVDDDGTGDTEGNTDDDEDTAGKIEDTDGDTEDTTEEAAGGTAIDGGTDVADGGTVNKAGETEETNGYTEIIDGKDTAETYGDTGAIDGEGTDWDTEVTEWDTEVTAWDTETIDGGHEDSDGVTEENNEDTEDMVMEGNTEETEDIDAKAKDTERDSKDTDASSVETTEKSGQAAKIHAGLKTTLAKKNSVLSAGAHGLSVQNRRQEDGPNAFEELRTANQQYKGVDFFVIEAKLPADGLSASENWCWDYLSLCTERYGLWPAGCGESNPDKNRCFEYSSWPYINNVLSCPPRVNVAEMANLAFSSGATEGRSFGFNNCSIQNCQRGIYESRFSLDSTVEAFSSDGTGDRIVYTVCTGSPDVVISSMEGCVQIRNVQVRGCSCRLGFMLMEDGLSCENINECDGVTCENGGTCVDGVNDYSCECSDGYEGEHCETDINDCDGVTCENGGTCVDGINDYSCECADGYEGEHCETDTDGCNPDPCVSMATCTDNVAPMTGAVCTCPPGYHGDGKIHGTGCTDISGCDPNPCVSIATCVDIPAPGTGAVCNCPSGYEGDGTMGGTGCADINDCDGVTCENGGTCVDGINDFSCECAYGFEGKHCETVAGEGNLAIGKTATQSSDYSHAGEVLGAGKAVDGSRATDIGQDKACTHTKTEYQPWWKVDLSRTYTVQRVSILNRGDCCGERLKNFMVRVGPNEDFAQNDQCGETYTDTPEDGQTITVYCSPPIPGRYVSVQLMGREDVLSLCEVEVFAETDINECNGMICHNGGICVDDICECANGYEGEHCERDIDDCEGVTCENGGTCVDGVNDYSCECADGYEGEHCETDNEPCDKPVDPGTCKAAFPRWFFNSQTGQCEQFIYGGCLGNSNNFVSEEACQDTCIVGKLNLALGKTATQSSDYSHGGEVLGAGKAVDGSRGTDIGQEKACTHTQRDYQPWWKVDLSSTYTVQRVSILNRGDCCGGRLKNFMVRVGPNEDFAQNDQCGETYMDTPEDGQTITVYCSPPIPGRYVSVQLMGREDFLSLCEVEVYAETDINECEGVICENGGACVDDINNYSCECADGFEGEHCETNINDCDGVTCENGGNCIDGINDYSCECTDGYKGNHCEEPGLPATTTCTNDYMELSIPENELTDINLGNLHWEPDQTCGASTNGTHYIFRTDLYRCGTQVTFGPKYVTFLNTINILGMPSGGGVITREGDISITSKCKFERQEWVDSTFLPIPGGLKFTEEGFGQLEVRLSMFPTRQYQSPYRASQYPVPLRMRQHIYMQLEVQGHGQKLSVLALNCKATMSPQPNDTPQYQLINDGCASDPTLQIYNINDNSKERFGFEAFRFIREVKTVYVHCEVMVCNAFDTGSRCAQGCNRRGKRATGEKADMKGRHMIYQGPIVLDDDKEETVRLMSDQETASGRHSAPWAMLAAGGGLMALALVVMGAAIVLKRSRREEWAYQGLPNMAEDGE